MSELEGAWMPATAACRKCRRQGQVVYRELAGGTAAGGAEQYHCEHCDARWSIGGGTGGATRADEIATNILYGGERGSSDE